MAHCHQWCNNMGKIKKILENELVGGTQTTDVYPVTSTKAVYDENNERLDKVLAASNEKLTELEKHRCVIQAGLYSSTTRFADLAEALNSIPLSVRTRKAILYYQDNSFNFHVYIFLSNNPNNDSVWNNIINWTPIYTGKEVDSIVSVINEELDKKQKELSERINRLNLNTKTVVSDFNKLPVVSFFNGVDSSVAITPITLQNNGDYFEATVYPLGSGNSIYGFAYRQNTYQIGIGLSKSQFFVRANDNSWIAQQVSIGEPKDKYIFKISYENDNMVVYIDGIETYRYYDQKTLTIGGFGVASSVSGWWKGYIGKLSINGVDYPTVEHISGYKSNNIDIGAMYGFLTEEQAEELDKVGKPNIVVVPNTSKIDVYTRINDKDVYAKFEIVHTINDTDNTGQNGYCNLWGLYNSGSLAKREGDNYEDIPNTSLLVGAENEFTVKFEGMGDFTGGYHGDERIDIEEDDYVEFIVDGKSYSISEIVAKGNIECDTFSYRQRSTLYASYVYNENHIKLGKHFKETSFDKGYTTRNLLKLDLSLLGIATLKAEIVFTGLVCPHKNIAHIITGDDGQKYTATNPSISVPLVDRINTYSRRVEMENGDYSCCIDSKVINTSVEEWKNSPINVQIMDRENDSKYYSYLQSGIDMVDGDYLATECAVSFNMRES